MGNPTVHLFGNLEDINTPALGSGALVAGAKVRVELSNFGPFIPRVTTGGTLAKGTGYAPNPSPGSFSTYLFRNDQIYPIGTFYTVIVEDADGNVIQCGAYRFNTDGDFDLATQTPIDAQAPPPPLPPTPPHSELQVVGLQPWGWDCDGGNYTAFQITATQNGVIDCQFAVPGNLYTFIVLQDAVGSHTLTWAGAIYNATAVCPIANSTTIQTFVADENGNLFAVSSATWLT